jgi:hypothetical protein
MDAFEASYPSSLVDRMLWFEKEIGINKRWLLQMMMLDGNDIYSFSYLKWDMIVNSKLEGCERVDKLLFHIIVTRYDYDHKKMAEDPKKMEHILVEMKSIPWYNDHLWNWYWRWTK